MSCLILSFLCLAAFKEEFFLFDSYSLCKRVRVKDLEAKSVFQIFIFVPVEWIQLTNAVYGVQLSLSPQPHDDYNSYLFFFIYTLFSNLPYFEYYEW